MELQLCTQVFGQWDNYGKTKHSATVVEKQRTRKCLNKATPRSQEIALPILGNLKHLEMALCQYFVGWKALSTFLCH